MPILPLVTRFVQAALAKGGAAGASGKAFGQKYLTDFGSGVQTGLKNDRAGFLAGRKAVRSVKEGITSLFFDIPKEVSKRRWGEHLAGALVKTTSARLASMNASLSVYGGSAQTYAHTMTALADKAFRLGFGEANWIPQLMKYTMGEYDPFGSGENGFKTQEENFEWFKNRYNGRKDLVNEARTVGNILGITPDIVKLIIDGRLKLLDRENHLTDKQIKQSEALAYQAAMTEVAKKEFFDILGAKFSPLGTAVESFKESVFKFGADILKGGKKGPGEDWDKLTPAEKATRALSNPLEANRYKDEGVSEAELYKAIKEKGGKSSDLLSAAEILGFKGEEKYATILARYNGFVKNNGIVGNYDPSLFTSQGEIERLKKADQSLEDAKRIRTDGYLYNPFMTDEQIKRIFDDINTRFTRGEMLRPNDISFLGGLNGRKGMPYVEIGTSMLTSGLDSAVGSYLRWKLSNIGLKDPSKMNREELNAYIKATAEELAARQSKKSQAIEEQKGLVNEVDDKGVDLIPSKENGNKLLEEQQKKWRNLRKLKYYDLPISPTGVNIAPEGLGGGSYARTYNNYAHIVVNSHAEAIEVQSSTLDEADAWLKGGEYEQRNQNILTATVVV